MPELDAERRERLAAWFHERGMCRPWEDNARCDCLEDADALTPLIVRWLAESWDSACEHDIATCRVDQCSFNPYRGGDDG